MHPGETFSDGLQILTRAIVFLKQILGVCRSKVCNDWSYCNLKLLHEATETVLAQKLTLHWQGEICSLYHGVPAKVSSSYGILWTAGRELQDLRHTGHIANMPQVWY